MTTKRRRRFTAAFKKRVVLEALRGDRTVQEIAARHEVHPNQVSTWKRQAVDGLDEIFAGSTGSRQSEHEATIRDLHAKIGELTVERDFFSARVGPLSRAVRVEMIERNAVCGLTIDRPNQVWCSDITYIPVTSGFLYLVAIMDWASRHVLAWRLSNTMDSSFCVDALEAALQMGTPDIFNTDRGRSLRARRSPSGFARRARSARWTGAGGAWTTSSSSGCGGR